MVVPISFAQTHRTGIIYLQVACVVSLRPLLLPLDYIVMTAVR